MTTGREGEDELEAMRGAWRALEVRWNLSELERRLLLRSGDAKASSLSEDVEHRMRLLIQVDYLLPFDEDEIRAWLRASAADLGDASPLEVLAGSIAELRRVRLLLESGQFS